jgi:hypothetical protein
MSKTHLDTTTHPPTLMQHMHGGYSDDENLDDTIDDEKDEDGMNDDDSTSIRTATTSTLHSASTTRRLTNNKVREIFEYLYHHSKPNDSPPNIPIPFTIVPVNSNGKALSPPSYEFECTFQLSIHMMR